eukprot:348338_1
MKAGADRIVGREETVHTSSSIIDIAVSLKDDQRSRVTIRDNLRIACWRTTNINIGHVPCRYVYIHIREGNPTSLYSICLLGIPMHLVGETLGPAMQDHLCFKASNLFFGTSQA